MYATAVLTVGDMMSWRRVPIVQARSDADGLLRLPQHLLSACEPKRGTGRHGESHGACSRAQERVRERHRRVRQRNLAQREEN